MEHWKFLSALAQEIPCVPYIPHFMKGVRKIRKHYKCYLQCFIFLLLFFLTGCSFGADNVSAEEMSSSSSNKVGYIVDSYDIKQPDKNAKKVMKTYDTDTEDVTHITVLSSLTDAAESVLSNIADHVKLRKEKREEEKNNEAITANNLGDYKKGKNLGTFVLTAYCPCRACSGKYGNHTSTGTIARANHTVAADNRVLKAGTWVIINNKLYRVEDVGGAVKGKHIDIYVNTHPETFTLGFDYANVYLAVRK